jgi:hypothetical protein
MHSLELDSGPRSVITAELVFQDRHCSRPAGSDRCLGPYWTLCPRSGSLRGVAAERAPMITITSTVGRDGLVTHCQVHHLGASGGCRFGDAG